MTLNLFFALIKLFAKQEGIEILPDKDSPEFISLMELIQKRIREAKYDYDRSQAAGYVHLIPQNEGGIRFISSKNAERPEGDSMLTISVKARRRAEYELEKIFNRRRIANTKCFKLNAQDLEKVRNYTNEYDGQEQMYQKLLGLQRASVIVLKKLNDEHRQPHIP